MKTPYIKTNKKIRDLRNMKFLYREVKNKKHPPDLSLYSIRDFFLHETGITLVRCVGHWMRGTQFIRWYRQDFNGEICGHGSIRYFLTRAKKEHRPTKEGNLK
jgi:hypothetical protein